MPFHGLFSNEHRISGSFTGSSIPPLNITQIVSRDDNGLFDAEATRLFERYNETVDPVETAYLKDKLTYTDILIYGNSDERDQIKQHEQFDPVQHLAIR